MALAGRLRHRVEWLDRDETSHGTTYAQVRGTNASEAELLGLDTGLVGISIRMREHPTISPGPGWTAVHGARRYNVSGSYDPVGRNRERVVVAVEAV